MFCARPELCAQNPAVHSSGSTSSPSPGQVSDLYTSCRPGCLWVGVAPAVLESRAERCCTRPQADTEPPGGQNPWDQDSEVRALLPINPGCTSAYHCMVICIHLHPFASKSTSTPHYTVPFSTSSKTKYLTSNSKVVVSKPPTQSRTFQVGFDDLVSAWACIWAVREMQEGENQALALGASQPRGEPNSWVGSWEKC